MESPEDLVAALEGYVRKLREESCTQLKQKLTDDTTAVRAFCQTVEQILRHSLKERLTFWGERRDYWGYLCEGCAGNKALDPIIKQLQSSAQVATSQGKGRAFIRKCLSEHLLAECMQAAISSGNGKKTREWYVTGAVLLIPQLSHQIVVALYDLGEVEFYLPLDGLDLDNTWPSFAIKSFQSPQRIPQNVGGASSSHSIATPTRIPSAIPTPKPQAVPSTSTSSLLNSQSSPVEQAVEGSMESVSSDSGQSSDHPANTSPATRDGFKTLNQSLLATPNAATIAVPTDSVRPASTTPSPLLPSSSIATSVASAQLATTLSIADLSDNSVVEEDAGDQHSGTAVEEGVVISTADWENISALLLAIQGSLKHHGDSNLNGGPPADQQQTPPPGNFINGNDVVTFLSSLKHYLEAILTSASGKVRSSQDEAEHLMSRVKGLEEDLAKATVNLERSHELEARLLKANRALQDQSTMFEQLKGENLRLREELEVAKAALPVQSEVTLETPMHTARSEPDGDEAGDLDHCLAQLASLKAEHGQCISSLEGSQQELATLRKGRQQLEQEIAVLRQDHQRALREQDAQHQVAYTLLREKMNEQVLSERKGRRTVEEERDRAVESMRAFKEASEHELNSLKYQLSSQVMALEQSKEMSVRGEKQIVDLKVSNVSLEKHVAELSAQVTLLEKALVNKTKELEQLQLMATKMQVELKSSREELTTLQMEKTVTRDKERGELLKLQTDLDASKKQVLSEKKETSRLARENEEIRRMFAKLLEQKASLWQLADQLENEHTNLEWVDSDSVPNCMACKEEFSLLNRKHHCRSCGRVFCSNCCSRKAMLASSKEPVRVCNACYKKQSNKTSRASEMINTLEESMSSPSNNTQPPPPVVTATASRLIQPNAPPPPLIPIQHAHSTNSLQRILLSQNSDHPSETGDGGVTGGILTPPRGSDSFIPDQLSSGPSSYTVHPIGRMNSRDLSKAIPEEEVGAGASDGGAVPRKPQAGTLATKKSEDAVARRQSDTSPTEREGSSNSGGSGSRTGKSALVSYSLEDYDGLTKDDSYVVIETQTSGSMFPLGVDSNQGQLDVSALATKLASLETAADREDRGSSTPGGWSSSLLSSDFKEVSLEGGASHKVTLNVETIGTVVGWEFSTEPKGLAFGIIFSKDGRQEEVLPLRRCTSHKATLTGEYVVQKKGKYILNFDNCHSKYSGRLLRYKTWQTPPV